MGHLAKKIFLLIINSWGNPIDRIMYNVDCTTHYIWSCKRIHFGMMWIKSKLCSIFLHPYYKKNLLRVKHLTYIITSLYCSCDVANEINLQNCAVTFTSHTATYSVNSLPMVLLLATSKYSCGTEEFYPVDQLCVNRWK